MIRPFGSKEAVFADCTVPETLDDGQDGGRGVIGLPARKRSRLTHSSSLSEAASRRSVFRFLRSSG